MEQNDLSESKQSSADFSSVLDGILSNPEMLGMISSIADKLKNGNSSEDPSVTATEESAVQAQSTVPLADMSQKLPEMLSTLAPLLSSQSQSSSAQESNRTCLLRALKPYLSSGRGEAIEQIIRFSKISGILKNLS